MGREFSASSFVVAVAVVLWTNGFAVIDGSVTVSSPVHALFRLDTPQGGPAIHAARELGVKEENIVAASVFTTERHNDPGALKLRAAVRSPRQRVRARKSSFAVLLHQQHGMTSGSAVQTNERHPR
jgi:hypothetical protein